MRPRTPVLLVVVAPTGFALYRWGAAEGMARPEQALAGRAPEARIDSEDPTVLD